MSIDFLKLDINIFSNKKIEVIEQYPAKDTLFKMWIWLLCNAMKSDHPGYVYIAKGFPCKPDYIASKLKTEIATVEMGLSLFTKLEMISVFENGTIEILNFDEYQKLDMIERKRQISRESSKKYREKHRKLLSHGDGHADSHVNKSDSTDLDTDKDLDSEPDKTKTPPNRRPTSPASEKDKKYRPLAELLFEEDQKTSPLKVTAQQREKKIASWSRDIRLLFESSKNGAVTVEVVTGVIRWCKDPENFPGEFSWVPNIRSGKKLREKFPMLLHQYRQWEKGQEKLAEEKRKKQRLEELRQDGW